jgi:hypothetical protein
MSTARERVDENVTRDGVRGHTVATVAFEAGPNERGTAEENVNT